MNSYDEYDLSKVINEDDLSKSYRIWKKSMKDYSSDEELIEP